MGPLSITGLLTGLLAILVIVGILLSLFYQSFFYWRLAKHYGFKISSGAILVTKLIKPGESIQLYSAEAEIRGHQVLVKSTLENNNILISLPAWINYIPRRGGSLLDNVTRVSIDGGEIKSSLSYSTSYSEIKNVIDSLPSSRTVHESQA